MFYFFLVHGLSVSFKIILNEGADTIAMISNDWKTVEKETVNGCKGFIQE